MGNAHASAPLDIDTSSSINNSSMMNSSWNNSNGNGAASAMLSPTGDMDKSASAAALETREELPLEDQQRRRRQKKKEEQALDEAAGFINTSTSTIGSTKEKKERRGKKKDKVPSLQAHMDEMEDFLKVVQSSKHMKRQIRENIKASSTNSNSIQR